MKTNMKKGLSTLMALSVITGTVGSGLLLGNERAAAKAKDPIQIEFWYGLGGKLGENMQKKISDFNASQKDVVVKGVAQASYTETYQALQGAIAARKAPAVVLLNNNQMSALASKKTLASLSGMIAKDAKFNGKDFIPSFYNQGNIGGQVYALPAYGTTQVMYYRKDYLKAANIKVESLKTWEAVYAAAKKLTKVSKGETSIFGFEPMWGAENLRDMAYSKGGKILSNDGKKVTIASKEWIDSWEAVRKAIFDTKTMRIHSGGQGWEYWYATIDDVMKDRAAGYIGSSGDQGDLDFSKIVAATQPGWANHEAAPVAEALTMSIPAITDKTQQEAAFKWMEYFTSAPVTADWSMKSGYIAVRKSATKEAAYAAFAKTNPQILVPITQASSGSSPFVDPTGGKILDALSKAADKVEIENIPAADALKSAQKEAQQALDEVLK